MIEELDEKIVQMKKDLEEFEIKAEHLEETKKSL